MNAIATAAVETIATMTRAELRSAVAAANGGSVPSDIRSSRAKLRAFLVSAVEEKVEAAEEQTEKPAEDATVEEKVAYIASAFATEDGERVVCPLSVLSDLGFGKTATTYSWWWNSIKAGRPNPGRAAAEALGFRATIRKVDGDRALVLTPSA